VPYQSKSKLQGISVVEVLIALAVLAIVLSFASTTFSNAALKKELQMAAEGVDFTLRNARSLARETGSSVLTHFNMGTDKSEHSITYSLPNRLNSANTGPEHGDFILPADIRMYTSQSDLRFDGRGLLDSPVEIELVSTQDATIKEILFFE